MSNGKSLWTLGEMATLLGLSRATIRNWSGQAGEFAEYLSSKAKPNKGAIRQFNVKDLQVMGFISNLRQQNLSYEAIHTQLKQGRHLSFQVTQELPKESLVEQSSKEELKGQIRALEEERNWLRNELTKTVAALINAEQRAAQAETKLAMIESPK